MLTAYRTEIDRSALWAAVVLAIYSVRMRIDLLYFGMLKELFGCGRESLELEDGARVEDALRLLRARTSNRLDAAQNGVWSSLAVAVNREYAGAATVLKDRDELALLPPVSGGLDRTKRVDRKNCGKRLGR